jgi:hypothetical protein
MKEPANERCALKNVSKLDISQFGFENAEFSPLVANVKF